MTTETESVQNVFEQAFDNLRKTAESNIEMQQELFRQWGANWPGFPQPQNAWVERVQKFQKAWAKTVKELLSKHREVLDEQYGLRLIRWKRRFVSRSLRIPKNTPNGANRCAARASKSCAKPASCKRRNCRNAANGQSGKSAT